LGLANYEIKKRSPEKGRREVTPDTTTDPYAADWFDNQNLSHGGTYGVRGPSGLVQATGPFKKDWEKAQTMAAEMNAAHGRVHETRQVGTAKFDVCDAVGCTALADWAYIGEGGDLYLCSLHGGKEPVEGWQWIGE
jgi:hypothetical protein